MNKMNMKWVISIKPTDRLQKCLQILFWESSHYKREEG